MEEPKNRRQLRAEKIQRAQRDISRLQRLNQILAICLAGAMAVLLLVTPWRHFRPALHRTPLIEPPWLVSLCLAVQMACTVTGCAAAGYAIFLHNRIPREFIPQPARQKRDRQIEGYWEAMGGLVLLEAVTLFCRFF